MNFLKWIASVGRLPVSALRILDRLDGASPTAYTIREVRVVEALEWIGNAEARRLRDKLAAGLPRRG